ncbi:MAG: hypothetical protein RJA57_1512 [Bacteroidota bacterium]
MLLQLSWRNTWRNRKRSGIIMAAVMVGLASGLFLMAFLHGMVQQRVETAVQQEVSHIQIHHPAFRKDLEPTYVIPDAASLLQAIRYRRDIKAVAARVVFKGMIGSPSGSSGVIIQGVQPEPEDGVTGLETKLVAGTYFTATPNELLIGEKLLRKLRLKKGSKAVLTFQDKDGNMAATAFRIRGVYRTVNTPYDETHVFVKNTDIDSLAGIQGDWNEIALLLKDGSRMEEIQRELSDQFPATEILNWKEIAPEIGLTVTASEQMAYIFTGIIILALAFGIVNTMLMAVLERSGEIRMLLSLGMSRMRIFSMIVLETLFLVLAGCPGGLGIALITIGITNRTGLHFEKFTEVYQSFGYRDVIHPSLKNEQLVQVLVLIVCTALLAAIVPAWKAIRLRPAGTPKN